jgi:hypothetical protein
MIHMENSKKQSDSDHSVAKSDSKFCTLQENPFEKCWFKKLISADTSKIAYYCGTGHHSECEIYLEHLTDLKTSHTGGS